MSEIILLYIISTDNKNHLLIINLPDKGTLLNCLVLILSLPFPGFKTKYTFSKNLNITIKPFLQPQHLHTGCCMQLKSVPLKFC